MKKWIQEGVEFISMYDSNSRSANEKAPLPEISNNSSFLSKEVTHTEMERLIKSRIGQSEFRKFLLQRDKKCVVCGISHEAFLIASHIKPWSESSHKERLDPNNGLVLCTIHDTIFDKGYISFEDNGAVLISPQLDSDLQNAFNITPKTKISLMRQQCSYMSMHRKIFNEMIIKNSTATNI